MRMEGAELLTQTGPQPLSGSPPAFTRGSWRTDIDGSLRFQQNVTKTVVPLYFLWSTLIRLRDLHFRCTRDTFPCILPATKSTCVPARASLLFSRSRIARRLSRELHTNCGTKVPLGNGLSRNADLGTASGTGPTHGHSLVSFGFELRGAFDLRQFPRGATAV